MQSIKRISWIAAAAWAMAIGFSINPPRAAEPADSSAAPVVVTNTYENFDGERALENVPVTFSRVGAEGDFIAGIAPAIGGAKLPAQVNVLRRAPDGSIRHALVSFVLPKLAAGGSVEVDWLNEKPAAPPAFRWGFDREAFDLKLTLIPQEGAPLVSDVGKILGANWAASVRVKVLHDGPVMKEFEIHDVVAARAGKSLNKKRDSSYAPIAPLIEPIAQSVQPAKPQKGAKK